MKTSPWDPRRRNLDGVWARWLRRAWLLVAVLALVACSAVADAPARDEQAAPADERSALAGVCPGVIVVQTTWYPQVEQAVVFQVLGQGYTPDPARKAVRGPLVATGGVDTGVDIEIRAGGPAIGGEPVAALMYLDDSITLGMVPADEAVLFSLEQPVVGVMAPFHRDPQVIFWSDGDHPEFNTIADIGQTDTPVLYFEGSAYMEYLVGSGILRRSQVDASYTGGPDRFVAEGGRIAVQGFATNEPYTWANEVPAWNKPLRYALVADTGYPNIRNMLAVRSGELEALAPCLDKLVPIFQQAMVDFMSDPGPVITRILDVIEATAPEYFDSVGRSEHAVEVMRQEQLVSNGTDGTIGNFDPDQVQELMDIVLPIYEGQNNEVAEDLTVEDIATNDFIDDSISLSPVAAASPGPTPSGQP